MPTTSNILPLGTYAAQNNRLVGPVAVPVGIVAFDLFLDASQFPGVAAGFRWDINSERSFDAGVTWEAAGGAGGDGTIQPACGFHVDLDQPTNPDRRLRATVAINQSVTTAVSITTYP